jgi:hypothetical protein
VKRKGWAGVRSQAGGLLRGGEETKLGRGKKVEFKVIYRKIGL